MTLGAGDIVAVYDVDGTPIASNRSVRKSPEFLPETVQDPVELTRGLQTIGRTLEAVQRSLPRGRRIFRVTVAAGGSVISARLHHKLGASVIVRLESVESTYTGTLSPGLNYKIDGSDKDTALVYLAQAASFAYTAVVGVEAV